MSAGLECMVPYLEPWKGFTVAGPLAGVDGGKILEVYLQRWPTDKKVRVMTFSVYPRYQVEDGRIMNTSITKRNK